MSEKNNYKMNCGAFFTGLALGALLIAFISYQIILIQQQKQKQNNEMFNPGPSRGGFDSSIKIISYDNDFNWLPMSQKKYAVAPLRSDSHLLSSHPLAFNSGVPIHSKRSCNVVL